MKKVILFLLAVILTGIGFYGCKKGPNDPTISFKSRKSRVTGDWKLTSGSETYANGSTIETRNDDGDNQTVSDGSSSYIDVHTLSYTMDKKGTYKTQEHREHKVVDKDIPLPTYTTTTTTTTDDSRTGTWNFTGGIGEYKNKSQLALTELTYATAQSVRIIVKAPSPTGTVLDTTTNTSNTQSYTGNPGGAEIWDLDELRSKKMVAKIKYTSIDAAGTTTSRDVTWTFEQ